MNKKTKIISALQALTALIIIGAIKIWAPVCDGMLELKNGRQVHMKCTYSAEAGFAICIIIIAIALVMFFSKKDHRIFQLVTIVSAIMLVLIFTTLIGICMKDTMSCHTTDVWVKAGAAVIAILALIDLFTGKEGQLPD